MAIFNKTTSLEDQLAAKESARVNMSDPPKILTASERCLHQKDIQKAW
jgi:hypothetical protein